MQVREFPDKTIVAFTATELLDDASVQEMERVIREFCLTSAASGKRLIVCFGGIELLSSALIGALVRSHTLARQHSLDLRLAQFSTTARKAFAITRLDKVFRFDDDDPDLLGMGVPPPKPPSTLDGQAKPPSE